MHKPLIWKSSTIWASWIASIFPYQPVAIPVKLSMCFNEKLWAHFHYIVKQHLHQTHYGVKRIRAVLIETVSPARAETFRTAARHPIVSGQTPSPLFWFTTSTLLTHGPQDSGAAPEASDTTPFFLQQPQIIFARIWATPTADTLSSLLD